MLSWKEGIKVDVLYSDCNIIDTHIQHKKSSFFASFIYGAPKKEDRPGFWSKLSDLGKARDSVWFLTGDFNDLLDNTEKVGGPLWWEGFFLAFRSFVSQAGLWDLPHAGNHLSWRGVRHEHFIQSRLDRAMANCSWSELFPLAAASTSGSRGPITAPFSHSLINQKHRRKALSGLTGD